MSEKLTMKELKQSIDQLRSELHLEVGGLRTDFVRLENTMNTRFREMREEANGKFFHLHSSIDRYLKRTENWHDEQVILKARHDRLSDSLVRKDVVTKEETLL